MLVGGQRNCCKAGAAAGFAENVVSISLNCGTRSTGPMIWIQPPFMPGTIAVDLTEAVIAVFLHPEVTGKGIHCHAKAVAMPIGEDLLDIFTDLTTHLGAGREERVIFRSCAIRVETQDHTCQVSIIGLRSAELIIWNHFVFAGAVIDIRGTTGQILQLTAPANIAHENIESAILAKFSTPPSWLPRGGCSSSP